MNPSLASISTLPLSKKYILHNPNPAPVEYIVTKVPLTVFGSTVTIATEKHQKYSTNYVLELQLSPESLTDTSLQVSLKI